MDIGAGLDAPPWRSPNHPPHTTSFCYLHLPRLGSLIERKEFACLVGYGRHHRKDRQVSMPKGRQNFVCKRRRCLARTGPEPTLGEEPDGQRQCQRAEQQTDLHSSLPGLSDTAACDCILETGTVACVAARGTGSSSFLALEKVSSIA